MRLDISLIVSSARRRQPRRDVEDLSHRPPEAVHPIEQGAHAREHLPQESGQVVGVPPPGYVRGPEADRSRSQQRLVGARVVHLDARHRIAGAQSMRPAGFHNLDRAAGAPSAGREDDLAGGLLQTGPHPARCGVAEEPTGIHRRDLLSHVRHGAVRRCRACRSGQGPDTGAAGERRRAPPSNRVGRLGSRYPPTRGG